MKYIFILFILTSCAQVVSLEVKSTPSKAIVYAQSLGDTNKVQIGQTPLQINSQEIQEKLNTKGIIKIEIEKDQFHTETFYLSDFSSRKVELSYNLIKLPSIDQANKVDEIIAQLFICQKYVKVKRYDDCQSILTTLKKQFPEVSTIYEFEGSIFYIQKQNKKAVNSFITALKYNPDNAEAKRMINIIRNVKGEND